MSEHPVESCPACGVPWTLPMPGIQGEGQVRCPACGALVRFQYWRKPPPHASDNGRGERRWLERGGRSG